MNETLIFFTNNPLSIRYSYSSLFCIYLRTIKTLLLIYFETLSFYIFYILKYLNIVMDF